MTNLDEIYFREANIDDLELLVTLRVDFIKDMKPNIDENKIEDIQKETRNYFRDLISKEEYIGFIGTINNEIVCCSGLLLYKLPPYIDTVDRVQGHLLNVYTYPIFRKLGYGTRMLEYVIERAKVRNIYRIFLNATQVGEILYKKFGFYEQEEKALILDI